MTSERDEAFDALDDALRRLVVSRADSAIARARHGAELLVREARQRADGHVERARRDGEAVADEMLARERSTLRRTTTAKVLESKQTALTELRTRVLREVLALRDAKDYAGLLNGLAARARAQLGPDAEIVFDPEDVGGVIATQGGRRVDYTLPALADRALRELGDELQEFWG